MKAGELRKLLVEGDVVEALKQADEVDDMKAAAVVLAEFAGGLNFFKGWNLVCEALLKKSIMLDPMQPLAHYNLGVLYSSPDVAEKDISFIDLALKHYRLAVEADPSFHAARYNMALLYFFIGKMELARRLYQEILDDVGDDRRFRELGMLFLEEERIEEQMLKG